MIHAFVFHKKTGTHRETDLPEALAASQDPQALVWINLFAFTVEEAQAVGAAFNIHELTLEDLANPRGRPKVEEFEDHLFVLFKALNFNEGEDRLDMINLNLLLFKNVLVTAHLKPVLSITETLEELRKHPAGLKSGSSFLMYRILDRVVDRYFPLLDEMEENMDEIQARIFEKFDKDVSGQIFQWKTQVAHLRRRVGPQREILMNLANRPQHLIPVKVQPYYRDVHDHIIRIHDNLESTRDILQGAMESYMTQVSNRMNEVMKVLSVVATIMLPLGILTGLYGTNFEILPGSHSPYGFWIFVGMMGLVVAAATVFFKLKKWF